MLIFLGVGKLLTNPEIASTERYDSSDPSCDSDLYVQICNCLHVLCSTEIMCPLIFRNYGFRNYGIEVIDHFKYNHQCNEYCKALKLHI